MMEPLECFCTHPQRTITRHFCLPPWTTKMAMSPPLWLAWHVSDCSIHTVAMVLTGIVLEHSFSSQHSSVLCVKWLENAVIPLIFSPGGRMHPAVLELYTHTCKHTSKTKILVQDWTCLINLNGRYCLENSNKKMFTLQLMFSSSLFYLAANAMHYPVKCSQKRQIKRRLIFR